MTSYKTGYNISSDEEKLKVETETAPAPAYRGKVMYEVACSQCGKPTLVPFRPDGRRPILCYTCYHKQKEVANGAQA